MSKKIFSKKILRKLGFLSCCPIWNPDVIALHNYRVLYHVIPKVACSSLSSLCSDLIGLNLPDNAWKANVFRDNRYDDLIEVKIRNLATLDSIEARRFSQYWKFAFVRDPYDRLVSCYAEKIRNDGSPEHFVNGVSRTLLPYGIFYGGMSFGDFVQAVAKIPDRDADVHFRSQYTFITDESERLIVDFIGYFEKINFDIKKVGDKIGVPVTLPHLLKSKRKPLPFYFDKKLKQIVFERYNKDYEIFKYQVL